ncbi:receptor-like protein kinase 7 [Nicotiana sylvestris]|uniref:non-specific serine/threonine protein kinase n=1 Tax=Nicotiana sylvestris TaxID=4096 RepID=A0A1U7VW77_NICSY|nr:PREDICTED: receptor-like protein kinase HAIKU2 [Nicotiana sylvestris]
MAALLNCRPELMFFSIFSFFSVAFSDELQTLLSIKSSLTNPTTKTNVFKNWEPNTPLCNFTGIKCNSNGSVKELELSSQSLSGFVPFDKICSLNSLEKLSLGFNSLSGRVTNDLNNCVSLNYLDVGNNDFTGTFPDISSLSELTHFYANKSGFSGKFPGNSVANMSKLIVLSLGDNSFYRTPFPEVILRLDSLNWLYLSNCGLEGEIPEGIGNLTELINLELSMNHLTGEIPSGITKLTKLWQLELYENELTGKLPVGFGNLTSLEYFDASTNYLYGDLSEIRELNNLVSLQLLQNEFSGEVPVELGEFKKLVNVSLYTNKLTGQLPQKLGSWANFDFIDISENNFNGLIPPDMCKKGTMRGLLILENNFTGEIPESYGNCTTLERFRVSKNSLSGVIPAGIWGLPKLQIIDVAMNNFEGFITSNIGNAKSLGEIYVANNKFSGELPLEISKATSLVRIDCSNNQFSGEIPGTIGELKKLGNLYLQKNKFSGSIPDSLGSCVSLSEINMAHNSLIGSIPVSLGSFPTLTSLNLSENQLTGQIPTSLSHLKLNLLDFSNNQLTGPIPDSLSIDAYKGSFSGNNGLCSQNIKHFRRCFGESGKPRELHTLLLCLLVAVIVVLLSLAGFMYLKKKNEKVHERSLKEHSWNTKSFHILTFTEDEILDGIKHDNLIGKGGSGSVYRVQLADGTDFAVKHIWTSDSGGRKMSGTTSPMLGKRGMKSKEFEAEVQTLSSIRHVNVVKLYCSITSEDSSLLVYEYMPNGSLWDRLHTCKKMPLDWETRYEIALGAAKGLEYLHHGCDKPVIHRDVKSSNILLDELFKPRIADFGLAKIAQADSNKDSTHVIAGTHGYIAPEYGYTHKVNEKSDVYSFGVVLMELISGKRPIEPEYGENSNIVTWVSSKLKSKESVLSIVDSSIPEAFKEDAIKVLRIAIVCTDRLPSLRPTMRNVVKMLEDAEPCKLVGIIVSKDDSSNKAEQLKDHTKI